MSNLLATGATSLAGWIKNHASVSVVYARSGTGSVTISATQGQTSFEQTDAEGFGIRIDTRDYIVTAADLVISAATITPERGDTITETDGSLTRTHTVLGVGNEPCYRWCDPSRKMIRIHTKQISVA